MTERSNSHGLKLTAHEIREWFQDSYSAAEFPALLSIEQVAKLLQLPKGTVYAMSSRGEFDGCKRHVGKYVRFVRDRLVIQLLNAPPKPPVLKKEKPKDE
jgi:excisionase family DNA binding protein